MGIETKTTYRSTSLPRAQERETLAGAEADEQRGIELQAYLALLSELDGERWIAARDTQTEAEQKSARDYAFLDATRAATRVGRRSAANVAWNAVLRIVGLHPDTGVELLNASIASTAIVARDHISVEHFDVLTAPMKAAGIDFDNLVSVGD